MSDCNKDCSSCSKDCKDRSFIVNPKESTKFKKIVGIVSGKGGVGKSFVTSLLAVASNKKGLKTCILDADVLGPSIPKAFGLNEKDRMQGSDEGLFPAVTKNGIKVASINLLLEEETMPVVWRGPVVSGVVKQFYTDVIWEENDIIFIDMPPGTGDIPLTVFQSIPINEVIVVSSPQSLVNMIVEKSVNMAKMMNIKVAGVIENMSYVECPTCNEKIEIFGKSNVEEVCEKQNISLLCKIPLNAKNRELVDSGRIEEIDTEFLNDIIDKIIKE